jgi:hypothetical protein
MTRGDAAEIFFHPASDLPRNRVRFSSRPEQRTQEIAHESGTRVRGVGDFEARAEFLVICARAA